MGRVCGGVGGRGGAWVGPRGQTKPFKMVHFAGQESMNLVLFGRVS